ncbi:hypothetical protein HDV05_005948 [Chytridiales sp. JEL 0842]|nr:hypothetical protein HDV05_005948 [Chytridiales sp. JEL 0842]
MNGFGKAASFRSQQEPAVAPPSIHEAKRLKPSANLGSVSNHPPTFASTQQKASLSAGSADQLKVILNMQPTFSLGSTSSFKSSSLNPPSNPLSNPTTFNPNIYYGSGKYRASIIGLEPLAPHPSQGVSLSPPALRPNFGASSLKSSSVSPGSSDSSPNTGGSNPTNVALIALTAIFGSLFLVVALLAAAMYIKWEKIRRATEAYQDTENGPEEQEITVVKVDKGKGRRSHYGAMAGGPESTSPTNGGGVVTAVAEES